DVARRSRDEQDGGVQLRVQRSDRGGDEVASSVAEAGGGVVYEQHGRAMEDRRCEIKAPAVGLRAVTDALVEDTVERDQFGDDAEGGFGRRSREPVQATLSDCHLARGLAPEWGRRSADDTDVAAHLSSSSCDIDPRDLQ